MSVYVMEVIREYRIKKNLSYFVIDNASNNDTIMTSLSYALRRNYKLLYDLIHYRIRCQGYVINLAVKSFLFVTDKENIEEDNVTNAYNTTIKEIEE